MFVGHTGERIQPAARTSCKHHSLHLRSTDCICFPELPRCPLSSREKIAYYSRLTCTCGPVTWIETIDEYILIDLHSKGFAALTRSCEVPWTYGCCDPLYAESPLTRVGISCARLLGYGQCEAVGNDTKARRK